MDGGSENPQVTMHEQEEARMRLLAGAPRWKSTERCPPAAEWAALAAGLADAAQTESLLAHASHCDTCGGALHAMVVDFSNQTTESEEQLLESLASARPEWPRQMARKMAREAAQPPVRKRVIEMPMRSWLARAAAVIVAVGAGWSGWNLWLAPDPARLIATAYTQQRPFEFRIPDAAYGQLQPIQRGQAHRRRGLLRCWRRKPRSRGSWRRIPAA